MSFRRAPQPYFSAVKPQQVFGGLSRLPAPHQRLYLRHSGSPFRKTWAQCYGGHQFGNWAGQLGDGRAISMGEVTGPSGKRWELQLKVSQFGWFHFGHMLAPCCLLHKHFAPPTSHSNTPCPLTLSTQIAAMRDCTLSAF